MIQINISESKPQIFGVYTPYGYYYFKFYWIEGEEGGWFLDVLDESKNSIINGIAVVCNTDLLEQFNYKLNFKLIFLSEKNYNPSRYNLHLQEVYLLW